MVWQEELGSQHDVRGHEVDIVSIIRRRHHLNEMIIIIKLLFLSMCNCTYVVLVVVPK